MFNTAIAALPKFNIQTHAPGARPTPVPNQRAIPPEAAVPPAAPARTRLHEATMLSRLLSSFVPRNLEHGAFNYWHDVHFTPDPNDPTGNRGQWHGWFNQKSVDTRHLQEGKISVNVNGRVQHFNTVDLPPNFLDWNFSHRLSQIQGMKEGRMPLLSGPHDVMVASTGMNRKDSLFPINNAVKGCGWLPREDKMDEIMTLLKATYHAPMPEKLTILENLYKRGPELFDTRKQSSLELYSTPNFETHTFLNEMTDPRVALVFLDMPKSFELRCVAQLISPENPNLNERDRKTVDFINLIHDYFHSTSPRPSIGVVYHVVEVFDNSPGRMNGIKVA